MGNNALAERQVDGDDGVLRWSDGGVALWTLDSVSLADRRRREIFPAGTARLVFCLEGAFTLSMLSPDAPPDCLLSTDRGVLLYYPAVCCGYAVVNDGPARGLSICLAGRHLPALLGDGGLECDLKTAIRAGRPLSLRRSLDRSTHHCLHQAVDILDSGTGGNLFLLSRLAELAWQFSGRSQALKAAGICGRDRRAVEKACALLAADLAEPPPLRHLAAEVGVSVSKLKVLFHRVCGVPPFGYLRRIRLEKARELLVYSRMNVTDVSLEVGYTSLSHFSKAFAGHYGVSPSQMRRDRSAAISNA